MKILCCLVFAILLCQGATVRAAGQEHHDVLLSQRVVRLLQQVGDDAAKWEQAAIAARVQCEVADLLWSFDEQQALQYLQAAWATTARIAEGAGERSFAVRRLLRNAVRREVLLVARKHAPQVAARWMPLVVDDDELTNPARSAVSMPPPPVRSSLKGSEQHLELLEQSASKGWDSLTRDIGYANAAVATTPETYERGLSLAGKIDDRILRTRLRSWLTQRATLVFIANERFAEAYRANLNNDDDLQRATCLVLGAQKLAALNDRAQAAEWLKSAALLVKQSPLHDRWTRIAFGIAAAYGRFDEDSALLWLVEGVKLMRRAPPGASDGFSLREAVAGVGPEKFDATLAVLNDVPAPELRGLAIVSLCRSVLNETLGGRKR